MLHRCITVLLLPLLPLLSHSQENILLIKKGNKVKKRLWKGNEFAFQTADQYWHKGKITRLTTDSLFIQPVTVKYHLMGADTISWPVEGYHFRDVVAIPRRGYLISMIDNRFQINRSAGHVHFYWIKSGVLFRVAGISYTGVMLFNHLSDKEPDKTAIKKGLLTGASVFLFGFVLKKIYHPVHRIGKHYHLQYLGYGNLQ